jgi:hypothetical protein
MVLQPGYFYVFLSHSQEDYALVYRVWDILYRLKAAPYMHELYPNYRQDIPTGIRDVIRNCFLCITFLTAKGINSQWVQQELGIAYAFNKVIVPVVEWGVQYKGFVQMVRQIMYVPTDPDSMIYEVIYAVRTSLLWQGVISVSLTCANHHEHDYPLPSINDLNKAISVGDVYVFKCVTCGIDIVINPKTLELRR